MSKLDEPWSRTIFTNFGPKKVNFCNFGAIFGEFQILAPIFSYLFNFRAQKAQKFLSSKIFVDLNESKSGHFAHWVGPLGLDVRSGSFD